MKVGPSFDDSESADPQLANKLSSEAQISAYRAEGSLWTWMSMFEGVLESFQPNERKIRGFECYQYSSPTIDPVISQVELDDSRLRNWLDSKIPLKNEEQPCAGYKILQFDANTSGDVPMTREDYVAMNEAFGLPPIGLHLPTKRQGACGMFVQDDDSFVFVQRPPWLRYMMTTVVRYNPSTNLTMGYIFTDDEDHRLGFLYYMHRQFLACPHPLLLPVLIDEIALESEVTNIETRRATLNDLETKTGFSIKSGANKLVTSTANDYQDLVTLVGEEQSVFLVNSVGFQTLKMSIESRLKHLERLNTILPEKTLQILRRPSIQLNDRLEYMMSSLEHARVHGNVEYRYKSLQAVLFNLIAQADNRINIGLSKDSKELAAASKVDSSAMKIIAFLTTVFLPGTFIATIFAMPLFNWDAPSISQVSTPHFWLYWAVTIPLTLATMAFVLSWAIWRGRQTQILVSRARDDSESKESGSENPDEDAERSAPGVNTKILLRNKFADVIRRRNAMNEKELC